MSKQVKALRLDASTSNQIAYFMQTTGLTNWSEAVLALVKVGLAVHNDSKSRRFYEVNPLVAHKNKGE